MPSDAEHSSDAQIAADYQAFAEPLTMQFVPSALALVGGDNSGPSVLDVAAGAGGLSVAAASVGAQVLAIDLSPAMVARLSERLKPYPNCAARVMDGQALTIGDGSFDTTFSMFGVANFPDWRRGLSELARVTRKGGHGCVCTWVDPRFAGPVLLLMDAIRATFPQISLPPLSEGVRALGQIDVLGAELAAAGFQDVQVSQLDAVWTSSSVDTFLAQRDRIFGHVPFYAALEEDDRRRLLPALSEFAKMAAADGPVRVTAPGLIAAGRRNSARN